MLNATMGHRRWYEKGCHNFYDAGRNAGLYGKARLRSPRWTTDQRDAYNAGYSDGQAEHNVPDPAPELTAKMAAIAAAGRVQNQPAYQRGYMAYRGGARRLFGANDPAVLRAWYAGYDAAAAARGRRGA